jgi:hypothetical protein
VRQITRQLSVQDKNVRIALPHHPTKSPKKEQQVGEFGRKYLSFKKIIDKRKHAN